MDWDDENPGHGDLSQLDSVSAQLTTWIGQFEAIATNSSANRAVITETVWSGSSTDAWATRFTSAMAPVTTLIDAFVAARAAIDLYGMTVLAIRRNAYGWQVQAKEARAVLHQSHAGNSNPSPEEEELIRQQQRDRARAQDDLDDALRMLQAYGQERAAADAALVAAFNAALPPEWPAQRDSLAAVGIDSIAEIANVGNLKDAMIDAANSVIDMDGKYEESAAALSALLALYADDEAVTSSFYQGLGGEKTVELVHQVGWYGDNNYLAPAAALLLAGAIRTGLSTASTGWTQNQAESFADGMMTKPSEQGPDIGYLFNGPDSPLGETLSVAMADAWDQWERVEGNHFELPEDPSGGFWLSMQEGGDWGMRVSDPSGPIFSTLGHYPDAAYEWLTSSDGADVPPDEYGLGAADDRVGYWFDTRFDVNAEGWSASNQDGLQGISDLFNGALQASGGPTDANGYQPTDVANLEDSATLTHNIILTLLDNQHFSQDGINAHTSVALAGIFGINMPAFAEFPLTTDLVGDIEDYGPYTTATGPGGGTVIVPVLSDEQLAKFLGVAGSYESGMGAITDSIHNYQQTLLDVSIAHPDTFPLSDTLDRIVSLDAALQGASWGEKIETGAEEDAAIREAVGAVTSVIGAVPIPGLGEALGGIAGFTVDWAQDAALEAVYGAATDGVPDVFATNEDYQTALADGSADDRDIHRRMLIAAMVHEYLTSTGVDPGFDMPPSPSDYADPSDYFDKATEWYSGNPVTTNMSANAIALDAALDANDISNQNVGQMASDATDTEVAYQARV